jgi:magnesium chelatase family protein
MSLAQVYTRALAGVNAPQVTVEVHLSNGLPALSIVGLPEAAVKESKDRVRSAIMNSGFEFPNRRLTINLAPADLPKEGGRFDLPIALGILAASEQIDKDKLQHYEFIGELSLSGALQMIPGVLPSIIQASQQQRNSIIPKDNADEARMVKQATIYPAQHLLEVTQHLATGNTLHPIEPSDQQVAIPKYTVDMSEVRGQAQAKRALEIAAAGQHSLLFIAAAVTSLSMQAVDINNGYIRKFRSPHHTASSVALVGGGSNPRPGEISLAHNGVLFLDELPEFDRRVLDSLREPLETGTIMISRAARQVEFPANVQLIAAMNPCPCGYLGDSRHACTDTPDQIQRYRGKITGPFLDRIDMFIDVPRLKINEQTHQTGEGSTTIRQRVLQARQVQLDRAGIANAKLKPAAMKASCVLSPEDERLLLTATERLGLSSRAHDRILRVARTIADLEQSENIQTNHLTEAINYRRYP